MVIQDGAVLAGERSAETTLPGLAEFPGGKCEVGELPMVCAVRECQEETGLLVVPEHQLAIVNWDYPHAAVELHFWQCRLGPGIPADLQPAAPFRWVSKAQLAELKFPAANGSVLGLLAPLLSGDTAAVEASS